MSKGDLNFVYFGTPRYAVLLLEELKSEGLIPGLIVTSPDKKQGRGMVLKSCPVKEWADKEEIRTLQPENLTDGKTLEELKSLAPDGGWDAFVIAAYGKIIPQEILDVPTHGTLNVHPSLLPKYRGPSPIETQIISDDPKLGVSVIRADAKMDHGPLLGQTEVELDEWPMKASELETILWTEGGKLLSYLFPKWLSGDVPEIEQIHSDATYTSFMKKEDALLNLEDDPYQNLLKIYAYNVWPRAHFFTKKPKRVRLVVTEASIDSGKLVLEKVIPEGKSEMAYHSFVKSVS